MIIVKELESIGELIDFPFLGGQKETVFPRRMNYTFRGQNRESYDLRSSLKRNSGSRTGYAEIRLLNNFRKYGELLEPQICKSIWNTMIVAQHHGVPTRCLDFSLSPLVALHFALTENVEYENACVWAINHGILHRELLPKEYIDMLNRRNAVSFTVEMFEDMGLTIEKYNKDMKDSCVVFLEPPSIDSRIVNQFSHLAILPDTLDPFDSFLENLTIEQVVYKFIIPKDKISLFRNQLDKMNITERVLFPGLDGLASYLKRRYSYE
ncbi:MAG: FRG domain-containing protein [Dorea sp.]|jgi:hypothetical protein|nr:FRG domain-containing protein [Dorea sp.]GFI42732.1 hypothetical protein IMSAGC018_00395 [Lachnospiraceae bacterium]